MAQGKEWNKEEVLTILEDFFKLGCSVSKACDYAGIPRTTVQTWIDNDEELRLKITAWQNELNIAARRTLANALKKKKNPSVSTAFEWLGKKEKDEFSERKEITGANGEDLFDDEHRAKANAAIAEVLDPADIGSGEQAGD